MSGIKELSVTARPEFPEDWYEITANDHCWTEWRFRAFLAQLEAHLRRYDKRTLGREATAAGFEVRDLRYWGFSMLPYLVARKLKTGREVSQRRVIESGLPREPRMNRLILAIMKLELAWMRKPVLGTSLLMASVKSTDRD